MKRGKRVLLVLAVCVTAGVVVGSFVWPGGAEPKYHGKRLSEWANTYDEDPTRVDAREAIQAMGNQVRPYALGLIRSGEPAWKQRVRDGVYRLSRLRRVRSWLLERFLGSPGAAGVRYLGVLGSNAAPAIPELEAIVTGSNGRQSAVFAMQALGNVGTDAVPALLRMATNRQVRLREYAMLQVNEITQDPAIVSPLFVDCVKDKDPDVALGALAMVEDMKLDSKLCVPALAEQVRSGSSQARGLAVMALSCFTNDVRSVVPVLLEALSDRDGDVRMEATNVLRNIAPEVLRNGVPR